MRPRRLSAIEVAELDEIERRATAKAAAAAPPHPLEAIPERYWQDFAKGATAYASGRPRTACPLREARRRRYWLEGYASEAGLRST